MGRGTPLLFRSTLALSLGLTPVYCTDVEVAKAIQDVEDRRLGINSPCQPPWGVEPLRLPCNVPTDGSWQNSPVFDGICTHH